MAKIKSSLNSDIGRSYLYTKTKTVNVLTVAGDDKTQPVEADEGPKMLFQSRGDPTGHICPMKFTVDSVLYEVKWQRVWRIQEPTIYILNRPFAIWLESTVAINKIDNIGPSQ